MRYSKSEVLLPHSALTVYGTGGRGPQAEKEQHKKTRGL